MFNLATVFCAALMSQLILPSKSNTHNYIFHKLLVLMANLYNNDAIFVLFIEPFSYETIITDIYALNGFFYYNLTGLTNLSMDVVLARVNSQKS